MIRLHVLVVDDETANREIVDATLSPDPFFVVRDCAYGAEALTAAIAWRPDLILLDTEMPNMDGPTVLKRLRADKRTAPISVVFLTSRGDQSERQRLTKLGAAGVITTPFDRSRLAAQIRGFIAAEGILLSAREAFLRRLKIDAGALAACRTSLMQAQPETALMRINKIAHSLAGAGGIYGFAGISCASAALLDATQDSLAGRCKPVAVERAINRLLERIAVN